ncbi:hypothetical protein [Sinorhizobium meliloti]|uniref:hypothetical protein n=1 Tax=Rhizobium meliloti TaxID=382 RepID=UPI000FD71C69|nr:hypothetical protein [Sinorhizobium meliloti]RVM15110.1 hypothetical protein CN134_15160 [Sinorhizobium meliloti]RVO28324.1 hypothetical protein CN098_21830 [Sinorhizobium meliloti]
MTKEAKGPAEAATSPSHGSTNPEKDQEMNENTNSTTDDVTPSLSTRIGDAQDILATVRYLNEAIFMAAGGLMNAEATNALQAVSGEIEYKLLAVRDSLDDIREVLKMTDLQSRRRELERRMEELAPLAVIASETVRDEAARKTVECCGSNVGGAK